MRGTSRPAGGGNGASRPDAGARGCRRRTAAACAGARRPLRGAVAHAALLALVSVSVLPPAGAAVTGVAAAPAAHESLPVAPAGVDAALFLPAQTSHLVVVSGLGGDDAYRQRFHEWSTAMVEAADRLGVPADNVVYLAERPEMAPDAIDAKATKENLLAALADLAGRVQPGDRVMLLLVGHGSSQGDRNLFNLPGPDVTAEDLAAALGAFDAQQVAVVNTASASGGFVARLSAPNRTIITATRDARQYDETRFGGHFVEAFGADVADLDKNGRVSLLEAYEYARREVARTYELDGALRTETALLDDNGDGEGSEEPASDGGDGAVAGVFYLAPPAAAVADPDAADDPELQALLQEKAELEARVLELRGLRDTMDPDLYQQELEAVLVRLARVDRTIREKGGGGRP